MTHHLEHLVRKANLCGQLYLLTEKEQKKAKTQFGISTLGQGSFSVRFHHNWRSAMFKNLWSFVHIEGDLDLYARSIQMNKMHLVNHGVGLAEQVESLDNDFFGDTSGALIAGL